MHILSAIASMHILSEQEIIWKKNRDKRLTLHKFQTIFKIEKCENFYYFYINILPIILSFCAKFALGRTRWESSAEFVCGPSPNGLKRNVAESPLTWFQGHISACGPNRCRRPPTRRPRPPPPPSPRRPRDPRPHSSGPCRRRGARWREVLAVLWFWNSQI